MASSSHKTHKQEFVQKLKKQGIKIGFTKPRSQITSLFQLPFKRAKALN
ncbi:hypothetical protein [Priestia koreensis]|nr:hypothetical protein [Priestia koreensis]MCM3004209.1 hypothetical protein [Priestia koreensis]UNL83425.1 hypothetical protein IE339_14750 [Priestia koreensis]